MTNINPGESPDATTIFEYHDLTPPTITDVFIAQRVINEWLPRTPLVRSDTLSASLDAECYLKREDTLPTGAFKIRGGINLVHDLPTEFRDPGIIAATTGNHGQSLAYAGDVFDIPVQIVVPEDANESKIRVMKRHGATVTYHGTDYDEARERAESLATTKGYRYVHSANEPRLIAGVATAGLEVLADLPEVDVVIVPVGGGSGAAGYCLTVGELAGARVIGVQAEGADAMYQGWHHGHLDPQKRADTFAEGLAARTPFAVTMEVLRDRLDGFHRVSDDELQSAIRTLLVEDHILIEGAAAAGVAAAEQLKDELVGQTIVIPLTGRNLSIQKLHWILDDHH